MAREIARVQRLVRYALWWVAVVSLAALGFMIAGVETGSASEITLGVLIFLTNTVIIRFAREVLVLSKLGQEPTEWMRRGGLMAEPQASAKPDEARIKAALSALPQDFPTADRESVEAYVLMPDDEDKQLRRDDLIRRFYERASSSTIDMPQRRAYNVLRHALSPWAHDEESDD